MRREPMIWAVAGMIFGFVLGYMVANVGEAARPAPAGAPVASGGASPEGPAHGRRASPTPMDPSEVRALESLAEKDKGNAQVRVELGNLYMDHARHDEAARWYREALALKPDAPDVLVDLGACLVNAGRAEEALAEFDKALKQDPSHKKALFNKGVALMEAGRPKEAVVVWEQLLKRYPDDPELKGLREQIDQVRDARTGSAS